MVKHDSLHHDCPIKIDVINIQICNKSYQPVVPMIFMSNPVGVEALKLHVPDQPKYF
jgi:hypothetical protein